MLLLPPLVIFGEFMHNCDHLICTTTCSCYEIQAPFIILDQNCAVLFSVQNQSHPLLPITTSSIFSSPHLSILLYITVLQMK